MNNFNIFEVVINYYNILEKNLKILFFQNRKNNNKYFMYLLTHNLILYIRKKNLLIVPKKYKKFMDLMGINNYKENLILIT